MTRVGVLNSFTNWFGDHRAYSSGLSHGVPLNSQSGNHSSSVPPNMARISYTPSCDTSALKRFVWPRIQLIMYPPYDAPAAPTRSRSTYDRLVVMWSATAIRSSYALPPQSLLISSTNFWP